MRAEYQVRFNELVVTGPRPSKDINGYMKLYMEKYRELKKREKASLK
jgi:hypothetical protein